MNGAGKMNEYQYEEPVFVLRVNELAELLTERNLQIFVDVSEELHDISGFTYFETMTNLKEWFYESIVIPSETIVTFKDLPRIYRMKKVTIDLDA